MENTMYSMYSSFIIAVTLSGVYAQVLIGPSPANQAVLRDTDHTLTCRRGPEGAEGAVAWEDDTDPRQTLFLNEDRQSELPKYTNFELDPANLYDLVITSIAVGDEGTYECRNLKDGISQSATINVEVRSSSLQMTQAGSGDTTLVTVTEGEPSEIKCTAIGARPAVTIDWYHMKDGGSETKITGGVNQVDTPSDDTFDSVSTLNYTTNKDYNRGSLRCVTTGQEVAESRQDTASLNVQFTPEPEVEFDGNDEITCKSTANPTVVESGYVIILNGTIQYPPTAPLSCADGMCTLVVDIMFTTDVRCNATNSVGTGSDSIEAIPGKTPSPAPATEGSTTKDNGGSGDGPNTAAIIGGVFAGIIVLAIIIAGLVYWFVVRPKGKGNTSKNSSEMRPVNNGSGDSAKPKPVAAPRSSTGNAHDNEEGKKKPANDNPDGLLYAELEHNKKPGRPDSGNNGNNIIRTEEPTQYADVKTFITQPPSPT